MTSSEEHLLEIHRATLIQGLQTVRFAVVAYLLLSLCAALELSPAVNWLAALLPLAILGGFVRCYQATGPLGASPLIAAIVLAVMGILCGLLPSGLMLRLFGAFGLLGLLLAAVSGTLLTLASMVGFLLYLSHLSTALRQPELGSHFTRLIAVLAAVLILPILSLALPPGLMMIGGLSSAALALMFFISFSGAIGKLGQQLG